MEIYVIVGFLIYCVLGFGIYLSVLNFSGRFEDDAERYFMMFVGDAEFAAIAAEFSKAPEAANGGLVGPVIIAILPQELKRQLLALQPGERSGVFQSEYGYHIVEPVEIKSAELHNEEKGKELARAALLANKKEEVFRRWVVQRRRGAQIEIINQLP